MIMLPKEFLEKELQELSISFPQVHIRYGYDEMIETHIVELLPLSEYNFNKDLDKAWIPISIKFMETYKDEEIAFISSDSTLHLEKWLLEFNVKHTYKENEVINSLFDVFYKETLNYTFPICITEPRLFESPNPAIINCHFEENRDNQISTDNTFLALAA
jgi:hypothetical protein